MAFAKEYDVVIIGGGVVGTAIARSIAKLNLRSALLEKNMEIAFGTTKANSGIVHAGFHSQPDTLKAKLCVEGNKMYPTLCQDLDVPFLQNGLLMVSYQKSDEANLKEYLSQGEKNGVPDLKILDRDELLALEPNLADNVSAGLLAPSGGIVSPFELAIAQSENAQTNGVDIVCDCSVNDLTSTKDSVTISTTKGQFQTKIIINAAGLFADNIARLLGDDSFRIKPRKGEEYLLDKRVGNLVSRTIFPLPTPNSKGILVIPTAHGNLMLGPTANEITARDEFSTTALGWEKIYNFCQKMVTGIEKRDLIASFAGIRAASDRGDFIIEFSPSCERLINVAGIESPGLTAAPAIGEMVLKMVREKLTTEGITVLDNPNFNPVLPKRLRLSQMSGTELDAAISKDKRFAHVICRCELVSEAEIVEAIKRGARTLDGVKLRTRAGMGRCQGGFCTPKILKIMSRELNIPVSEITKRGNGSKLIPYTAKELL